MSWLASVRQRVAVVSVAALAVTVAALVVALGTAASARAADRQLSEHLIPAATQASQLLQIYSDQVNFLRDYVTTGDSSSIHLYEDSTRHAAPAFVHLTGYISGYPDLRRLAAAAYAAEHDWIDHVALPQVAAIERGDFRRARSLQDNLAAVRPYVLASRAAVAAVQSRITADQAVVASRLTSAQERLLAALAAVCLLVVVVSAGWFVVVRRWLLQPLTALRGAAEAIAAGQYETPMPVAGPAEFADLGRATEHMRTGLIAATAARLALQAEQDRLRAEAEREQVARRLQQSERLESLGQLVGGVAHDFNNLLNVIIGYADFAGEQLAEMADDERAAAVAADVAQVRGASEQAARLTRQLLTFARRDVARPEPLDLNEIVRTAEQLLRRTLGERIMLLVDTEPALWLVVADRGQVEQILVNLAINARDAMPDGGRLSISTGDIDVDAVYATAHPGVEPGRYVRLRVSDTGTGMDRATIDRVFEPFFTTKPKGHGSGLGLATVYGIVTQAGGSIQVYSEPGLGTTISVLLPAADPEAEAGARAATAPDGTDVAGHGETILLVDDEASIRELADRILTGNGYLVRVMASGQDAIAVAAQPDIPVDLLLTDVVMPGMLGPEVAGRVCDLRPGLPVLYMSGHAEPALRGHAPQIDANLIEKPFTRQALLRRVRLALENR